MYKLYLISGSIILFQGMVTSSFAQDNCDATSLDSAEYRYEIGRFDECISGLNTCLIVKPGFNVDEKIQAYHLLALSYLAMDSAINADLAIEELLLLKDNFEADLRDPERFRSRIAFIKSNTVYSVSKRNEDIRLAPATAVIITGEEMLQRGYTDLIEVLKDIPGVDISIYYGRLYANVYQRGFRTNNTEKTLLLFDGVEDNDLWSNFAHISQQYPLTNIKRIEVIYGPASTMYGPNAFSGVINIITKEPAEYLKDKKSFGINASVGMGSYNTKYIDISSAFKKGIVSGSLTARLYSSDRPDLSSDSLWDYDPAAYDDTTIYKYTKWGIRDTAKEYLIRNNLPFKSPLYRVSRDSSNLILTDSGAAEARRLDKELFSKNEAFTKFINPAKSWYISGRINISDVSIGFASWVKDEGYGTTFTDLIASVSGSKFIVAHTYFYINYNKRLNEKLFFTTDLNYKIHAIKNGSKITEITDYSLNGGLEVKDLVNGTPASWLTRYYYQQSEQFRLELKLLYTRSKYFYLISGIELRNSQLQGYYLTDTTSATPEYDGNHPNIPGGNQYNVYDAGFYSQGSYRAKTGIGITLGARLDYDQIKQGEGLGYHLSPRFVVDYIKKGWVLKAIVSKGIQNVSNYTKYNDISLEPNPSLKSESIYNYEISVSKKISAVFLADIDFYYSNIKDVVSIIPHAFTDTTFSKIHNGNIGEYRIKGIQTNLYYKSPNKNWQATINYAYTDPRQTADSITIGSRVSSIDNVVGGISFHKINVIVNYIFLKKFNLNFRANYVSGQKSGIGTTIPINAEHLKGSVVGNVTVSAFNLLKGATVQFVCNNIFNTIYYTPGIEGAGGIRVPDKIIQMGRNFSVRINYTF